MALTRKSLSAMGIEPEKIDEIITLHSETVEALKEQRDGYKATADTLPDVQSKLDEATNELEKMRKATEKDAPYKTKFEKLQKEYDEYKTGISEKETRAKVKEAYKNILKDAKIADKYINVIMKATDMSGFRLDEDGNLVGAEEATKNAAEEWPEFVEKTSKTGTKVETPPENNGGKMTKDEIMAIKDKNERQQAISENHELFGY